MGGEESVEALPVVSPSGLPPRGRGRGSPRWRWRPCRRITPAWAGKRLITLLKTCRNVDYPRVGGEEHGRSKLIALCAGLPPRGRGRGQHPLRHRIGNGITPAWAGKSRHPRRHGVASLDYPRVGGEEPEGVTSIGERAGLPPRGRGRETAQHLVLPHRRITPAWAGKSAATYKQTLADKDYPRVGGEEDDKNRGLRVLRGLPPRGRGRVRRCEMADGNTRITPAWAGKSQFVKGLLRQDRDYPRVGGEEEQLTATEYVEEGLPPRGRGRDSQIADKTLKPRITPAWAGKRGAVCSPCPRWGDYPRVGGEEEVPRAAPLVA